MKNNEPRAFKPDYLIATDMQFDMDSKIIEALMVSLGKTITGEQRVKAREDNDLRLKACGNCPVERLAIWNEEEVHEEVQEDK